MDTVGPVLLLAFNCLGIPAIFFFLGVAWSRGWLRSPIHIKRDTDTYADYDGVDE